MSLPIPLCYNGTAAMVANELAKTLLIIDTQVPVVVLEDVKAAVKGGLGELPLRKGARIELPLREALPLIKRRVLELDAERLPGYKEFMKIRWMESRDLSAPQEISPDFYVKARLALLLLEERDEDPQEIKKIRAAVIDIVRIRLQKIIRAVLANPEYSRELAEKLTIEERALYSLLCKAVGDWYASMREFIERGDPLG